MTEEKEQGDRAPAADLTGQEPAGLLRDVGVPDQHVLAEADVGPEDHAEGEQELPEVLVVLAVDDVAESTERLDPQGRDDDAREACGAAAREEVDAEHGAEPVRV